MKAVKEKRRDSNDITREKGKLNSDQEYGDSDEGKVSSSDNFDSLPQGHIIHSIDVQKFGMSFGEKKVEVSNPSEDLEIFLDSLGYQYMWVNLKEYGFSTVLELA